MPNVVNWFEIPVLDMDKAVKFYKEVFEVEFDMMDMGPLQLAMFAGSDRETYGVTGALTKGDGYAPSAEGSVVFFASEDVNTPLGKIEAAGGKILVPRTSIGKHGFIAHFLDCEGNHVAVHSMK